MRRAVLVASVLALAPAASAQTQLASLPSPVEVRAPGPPPQVPPAAPAPVVVPAGPIAATQRVEVDLDPTGAPVAVRVTQRIVVGGVGDYTFGVDGPITRVEAARGSQSEPGLRRNRILWRGFSAGGRVLAARAALRVAPAARALPLSVRVEEVAGGVRLHLRNLTGSRLATFAGDVSAAQSAALLDELRRSGPAAVEQPAVRVSGPISPRTLAVHAPLAVSGTARLGSGAATPIDTVLEARELVVTLRGSGPVRVELEARPVAPAGLLEPPAATWRAALASEDAPGPAALLERVERVLGGLARAHQYDAYLPVPGRASSKTVYALRVVAARAPPPPAPADGSRLPLVALVAGAAILAAGAAVAWAHL